MNPAKHPTVMVADSHEDTRRLFKVWLEAEGYRVVEAADGREAFQLTADECPDLVIMSTRMPVLGGLEAARLIRERGEECTFPIVAMSTFPTARERALALAAGCDEFVALPTPLRSLSKLVGDLLHGTSVRQPQESG
ncbi:MAG TPA: response regulator [Pyrinomonadaceae bacterium]|nr:response regulator [Pyrinomonadaceae bacterium]